MLPSKHTIPEEIQPPISEYVEQPEVTQRPPERSPPIAQAPPTKKYTGFKWTLAGNEPPLLSSHDFDFKFKKQEPPAVDLQQILRETQRKNEEEQRRLHQEKSKQLLIQDELQMERKRAQAKIQAEKDAREEAERKDLEAEEERKRVETQRTEDEKFKTQEIDLEVDEFIQELDFLDLWTFDKCSAIRFPVEVPHPLDHLTRFTQSQTSM